MPSIEEFVRALQGKGSPPPAQATDPLAPLFDPMLRMESDIPNAGILQKQNPPFLKMQPHLQPRGLRKLLEIPYAPKYIGPPLPGGYTDLPKRYGNGVY